MLQLQTTLACPKPESPVSPKIFFTSSNGSEDEDDEGSTAQATVTTVLDPHRRSPPPGHRPVLRTIRSTEEEHVLSVHLPGFTPEMVTVSARKDDRLAVVADLWHAEANSHHEWIVTFPARDVNVAFARAQFSPDGTLTIHIPRIHPNLYLMRSLVV